MNNQQFRKLVLDTPARQRLNSDKTTGATTRRDGAATTLGSRMHSSIPMTPYEFLPPKFFYDTYIDAVLLAGL